MYLDNKFFLKSKLMYSKMFDLKFKNFNSGILAGRVKESLCFVLIKKIMVLLGHNGYLDLDSTMWQFKYK